MLFEVDAEFAGVVSELDGTSGASAGGGEVRPGGAIVRVVVEGVGRSVCDLAVLDYGMNVGGKVGRESVVDRSLDSYSRSTNAQLCTKGPVHAARYFQFVNQASG